MYLIIYWRVLYYKYKTSESGLVEKYPQIQSLWIRLVLNWELNRRHNITRIELLVFWWVHSETFSLSVFETSHSELYCKSHSCSTPRESFNSDLSIPQIKVMWMCTARQTGLFSLSLECFFFSPPLQSISSLSFSSWFLSFCVFPYIRTYWPVTQGRWLFCLGKDKKRARTLDLCEQWAVLILFWEHVGSAWCQCPAFAQKLPPGRGASSPTHGTISTVSAPTCPVLDST